MNGVRVGKKFVTAGCLSSTVRQATCAGGVARKLSNPISLSLVEVAMVKASDHAVRPSCLHAAASGGRLTIWTFSDCGGLMIRNAYFMSDAENDTEVGASSCRRCIGLME